MGDVAMFPGVNPEDLDNSLVVEDADDLDVRCERQSRFLDRWQALGEEFKRRVEVPLDLALELSDLLDEIDS